LRKIGFVGDHYHPRFWMALAEFEGGYGFFLEIAGGTIDNVEEQVRFGDFAVASLDSLVLNLLVRVAESGGIGKAEHGFFVDKALFDIVAGGTGHVADDGPFLAEQGVEKAGFSGVWPASDDGGNALRKKVPFAVRVYEAGDFALEALNLQTESVAALELYILFAEIELELEKAVEPGGYTVRFEAPPADIRFHVRLGDDESDEQLIRVVRPPAIVEGALTVEPPSYTGRPAQVLSIGNADIPEYALVTFSVTCDRPVTSCELDLGEERHPFRGDGPVFRLENVRFHSSMRYAVRLVDGAGIENRDRITYSLRLVHDREPSVVLERPEKDQYWAPVSRLRWRIRATDDHGMVGVTLRCQVGEPTEDGEATIRRTKSLDLAALNLERESMLSGVQELTDLGVQSGQVLILTALVQDACDFRGAPQVGSSRPCRLHVVSAEELRRIIEEEEQQITRTIDDLAADVDRQIRIIEMRQELVKP